MQQEGVNEPDLASIRRAELREQYMRLAYTIVILTLIGFIAMLLVYVTEPMSSPNGNSTEIPHLPLYDELKQEHRYT